MTWDEPANTGPEINDYDVQYREGASGGFSAWTHNSAQRTATITGLTPGTSYQAQVLARNDEGTSEWSQSGEGRTNTTGPPGKPDPPTLTASFPLTLRIQWTAPENSGSTPITGYKLQYGKDGGQLEEYFRVFTDTETTFRSQPPGTDFEIQVRAINNDGTGEWSNSAFGLVQPNKLPTFDEASPVRSYAENTVAGQNIGEPLFVTDDYIGHVGIAFSLEGTDAENFNIVKVLGRRGQLQTKEGVTYDYETNNVYSVTVKAVDPQGGSATVDATIELTDVDEPPNKPGTPKVEASTLTSLTLIWTAPDNTGKPAISSYDVQYRIGSGNFTVVNYDGTDTRATVGSLNANTDYELQVRAINDEGAGEWSDSATGTTFNEPPTVTALDDRALTVGGGAEIIRLIDGFNDTQHGIAWYAAASNNNAVATVRVAGDHLTIRPVAAGNTSVEITAHDEYGLSATQTIDVSVQAATLPNSVVAFDTDNEDLTIQFTDRFEAEETRAYDVRVRQQNPLGLVGQTRAAGKSSWVTGCVEQSNPDTSAADISIMASLEVDLDAGTAYEVDYRYRGEPCSVRDYSPGLWSRKVEYTASGTSSFDIEFVFKDFTPTAAKKALFDAAEERWESIIKNSLPDYSVSGEVVNDLRIEVELGSLFTGAASASVRNRRLETRLPAVSRIKIDETYYNNSLSDDLFKSIILHEMAHALGFSANAVVWRHYLRDRSDYDQIGDEIPASHFLGLLAISAFNAAGGADYAGAKVPVEDGSTRLTSASDRHHWRESVLRDELMTPIAESALISAITIQAMADIGYVVDVTQADTYTLPTPSSSKIAKTSVQQVPLECVPGHSVETEMFEVPDAFPGVLESTILKIRVIGER